MALDLTPFRKAVARLEEALAMAAAAPSNELLRDGVVQRFEYTYELSHKSLRRFLETTEPSREVVEDLSFSNLISLATARHLLLSDWETWHKYREARGTTSRAYDGVKAAAVFTKIPDFLVEAQHMLAAMERFLTS